MQGDDGMGEVMRGPTAPTGARGPRAGRARRRPVGARRVAVRAVVSAVLTVAVVLAVAAFGQGRGPGGQPVDVAADDRTPEAVAGSADVSASASSEPTDTVTSTATATAAPTVPPDVPAETSPPTSTPEPSPLPAPFEPVAVEVYPNAKREAARVVTRLTTYGPGETPESVAATLVAGPAAHELATVAAPLFVPGATSTGVVRYAQLGGLAEPQAAVMVVVAQRVEVDGAVLREEVRTFDVRLREVGTGWVLEEVPSIGGEPVERPADLDPLAARVVDDPRITMPDSARWDIYRGTIDLRLLETMSEMAELSPYAVAVLASGHPLNVFGRAWASNHTRGRAVDVYAIGGSLVIQQWAEGSAAHRMARMLYEQGIPELGTPWVFTDLGGGSFSDTVHADHLHVAYDG